VITRLKDGTHVTDRYLQVSLYTLASIPILHHSIIKIKHIVTVSQPNTPRTKLSSEEKRWRAADRKARWRAQFNTLAVTTQGPTSQGTNVALQSAARFSEVKRHEVEAATPATTLYLSSQPHQILPTSLASLEAKVTQSN
jgi:hypothetical protein